MGFLDKILKSKQKSNKTDELLDTIEDFDDVYSSNNNKSNSNLNCDKFIESPLMSVSEIGLLKV